jgi:hypothetical protein
MGFTLHLPATVGERAAIDFEAARTLDTSVGLDVHRSRTYDDIISRIERRTGTKLDNPYVVRRAVRGEHRPSLEEQEEQFNTALNELLEKHPDFARELEAVRSLRSLGMPDTASELSEVDQIVAMERQLLRDKQELIRLRTNSPEVSIAGLAAGMAGVLTDPPLLASLLIPAATGARVLRFALIEAAIGAGVEVPIQAAVQLGRRRVGEEPSFSEAMQNVLAAGLGGAALGGLIRGVPASVRYARGLLTRAEELPVQTAEVRSAASVLERVTDAQESSPLAPTARGMQEHLARLDSSMAALREGRVAELPTPTTPISRAALAVAEAQAVGLPDPLAVAVREAVSDVGQAATRRATIAALSPLADNADAAASMLSMLQRQDKPLTSLLPFLRKNAGIAPDDRLRQGADVKPQSLPGLIRKEGRSLDDAVQVAREAGYPVENVDDLIKAMKQELDGSLVRPANLEREALAMLREGLESFGIDVRSIRDLEGFQNAIRSLPRAADIQPTPAPSAARRPQVDDVPEEVPLTQRIAEEEQELVRSYQGRENERITISEPDGSTRTTTVREMMQEMDRKANDVEALRFCTGRA